MTTTPASPTATTNHPHGSHVRGYLRIFLVLLVLTVLEYVFARAFAEAEKPVLIGGLVALAVVKAILVGLFFMHLAFEGRWKYLVLIPTAFLATVVVLGLYPDMAFPRADNPGVENGIEPAPTPALPARP
jgi:cytochrome c oxidase subunit 4